MSDPAEQVQGTGEQATGATGSSPASGDQAARIAQLEADNAKLRDERRTDRANALGAAHNLTKTQIELLAGQPADKQEQLAQQIADEVKGQQPAKPPANPGEAKTGNPDTQPDLNATPEAERAQAAFGQDTGQQPVGSAAPQSLQDRMNAEMSKAETFEDMQEIQQRYRQEEREARTRNRDAAG